MLCGFLPFAELDRSFCEEVLIHVSLLELLSTFLQPRQRVPVELGFGINGLEIPFCFGQTLDCSGKVAVLDSAQLTGEAAVVTSALPLDAAEQATYRSV